MSEKEKLLNYFKNKKTTTAKNRMGCSENWYSSFFSISETFSEQEIIEMTEKEICNLIKLAENIADGLY